MAGWPAAAGVGSVVAAPWGVPVLAAEVTVCALWSAAPLRAGCGPVAYSSPAAAPPPASTMADAAAARRIRLDGGFRCRGPGRPRPAPAPYGLMPFRYSHVSVSSWFRYGPVSGPTSYRYVRVSVFIWGTSGLLRGEVLERWTCRLTG